MLLNIMLFSSKIWKKVTMGVCIVSLFLIKIYATCFQITHKTMALPILKIS